MQVRRVACKILLEYLECRRVAPAAIQWLTLRNRLVTSGDVPDNLAKVQRFVRWPHDNLVDASFKSCGAHSRRARAA